jgi:hypothetical protein
MCFGNTGDTQAAPARRRRPLRTPDNAAEIARAVQAARERRDGARAARTAAIDRMVAEAVDRGDPETDRAY